MFSCQVFKRLRAVLTRRPAPPNAEPSPIGNDDSTIKRARDLFKRVGVKCEYEPDWVTEGKKPDFYCSGSADFWCEVKTLEQPEHFLRLGDAHEELRNRTSGIALHGHGFAYVSDDLTHRDAKIVTHLLHRALKRLNGSNPPDSVVALVPNSPIYNDFVRFSISTREQSAVEFHSCVSTIGKYGSPNGMFPEPYDQTTQLHFSSGEVTDVMAGKLTTLRDDFRVAITADRNGHRFQIVATAPTGMARKIRNPERIRDAADEANSQLKNGIAYKAAPCLLMIYHDGVDVPDDEIIKSALYGDLKYSFSPPNFSDGKLILAGNGAWTHNKNRTTSAVAYVRNNGAPLIVHNYWAYRKFPSAALQCKEIFAREDGTFEMRDYSTT